MTFDQCDAALAALRRTQGTPNPKVRIDLAGGPFLGRVAHADSDPEARRTIQGPYGLIVLESLGLARAPRAVLQIADIPEGAIRPADD